MQEDGRFDCGTMRKKRLLIKPLVLSVAICALLLSVIGGSLAWLTASTDPIVNVFTYGDIRITLEETTGEYYKMVPGKTVAKDPKLSVLAESEDCWLFIKVEESATEALDAYIEYEIADGWIPLENTDGVYYREVDYSDQTVSYSVLKDDKVKVKDEVTREMLIKLNASNYPKLTFTGYAVQRDAQIDAIDTAEEAWALVKGN